MFKVLTPKTLGKPQDFAGALWFIAAGNQQTVQAHTGPVGTGADIYNNIADWLMGQRWVVKKVDEFIDVSPVHQQYYALTVSQKQELETKIKTGLAGAAQAVADYELLMHDARKLKEVLNYFEAVEEGNNKEFQKGKKKEEVEKIKKDAETGEAALKAMFIDQVDVHTGEGVALRNIVQRWPTIIVDFQKLNDEDKTKDEIKNRLKDISEAEALVLSVKQRLYQEWKTLFKQAASDRYKRISSLLEGRKASINAYKQWVKPYLVRHQMMKDLYENPEMHADKWTGLRHPYFTAGTAFAQHKIEMWAFRPFYPPQWRKVPVERYTQNQGFAIDPWDNVAKAMVFGGTVRGKRWLNFDENAAGKEKGEESLQAHYPWLTEEMVEGWVQKWKKDSIQNTESPMYAKEKPAKTWEPLDPFAMYYQMILFEIERLIRRTPIGEVEDIEINMKHVFLSQNSMLIKLIELRAAEEDFERRIDMILGLREEGGKMEKVEDLLKKQYELLYKGGDKSGKKGKSENKLMQKFAPKRVLNAAGYGVKKFFLTFGVDVAFIKGGNYEVNMRDIITAYYLRSMIPGFKELMDKIKEWFKYAA